MDRASTEYWQPVPVPAALPPGLVSVSVRTVVGALVVAVAYFLGARIGFALTFQPHPVSTLWPPNSLLFAALLLTPARSWWAVILAVFPAHVVAELASGVPGIMIVCWFISNVSEALIGAVCVRRLVAGPLRFDSSRHVGVFLLAAILAIFLSSFLDSAFVKLVGWGEGDYWKVWRIRFFSNLLAALTLVPVIVSWSTARFAAIRAAPFGRVVETAVLAVGLLAVSIPVFAAQRAGPDTVPALLYVPLPFLLWAAVRFGPIGISSSVVAVTFVAIFGAVHGYGPFVASSPTDNALSIQLFLIVVSIPLLLLAAVLQERRQAEQGARQNAERLTLALNAARMGACEAVAANKPGDRSILIETAHVNTETLLISVVDNGSGIPASSMEKLFEPFFTTKTQGLGLGLAICHSIAVAHGGRLSAVNNPDRGAIFHLSLPPESTKADSVSDRFL